MSAESVSNDQSNSETGNESVIFSGADASPNSSSFDDLIRVLRVDSCLSLSGQSTLTYEIGVKGDSALYVRLIGNTGGGLFSDEWISCDLLEDFIKGKTKLTSGSFKAFFPNKSVNTGGFVMAVTKSLGLIGVSELTSRWHEHVSGMAFEGLLIECARQEEDLKKVEASKVKRKSKGV